MKAVLIAGGTGRLGTQVTHLLAARGFRLRILTRDPERAAHLQSQLGDLAHLLDIVPGDVRDPEAVSSAMAEVEVVVSAIHGFAGKGEDGCRTVDWQGNSNLIRAARDCGVGHFILVSIYGAAPHHPMGLFRMKYRAEQELRASGLSWTIIRPTAYMETWAALIGEPLVKAGRTRIFGWGKNPINFVSVYDVARYVEVAVIDSALQGAVLEVGGPENLTMRQVAQTFEAITGMNGAVSHVPLPVMRLMSVLVRPINHALARQIQAGVVMDTHDMTFDHTQTACLSPSILQTSLADVVRRDYAS
jgi:uncharacterized protein YbjT (DUF2867 family)